MPILNNPSIPKFFYLQWKSFTKNKALDKKILPWNRGYFNVFYFYKEKTL